MIWEILMYIMNPKLRIPECSEKHIFFNISQFPIFLKINNHEHRYTYIPRYVYRRIHFLWSIYIYEYSSHKYSVMATVPVRKSWVVAHICG